VAIENHDEYEYHGRSCAAAVALAPAASARAAKSAPISAGSFLGTEQNASAASSSGGAV
jgi:hypothetical protein